ncbi:hypothetical protein DFH06DRAFT_1156601 [Mycena polygramma]|nr:hypothetical protein DFH06DRAFT_1156601 [Mycena polygramma]
MFWRLRSNSLASFFQDVFSCNLQFSSLGVIDHQKNSARCYIQLTRPVRIILLQYFTSAANWLLPIFTALDCSDGCRSQAFSPRASCSRRRYFKHHILILNDRFDLCPGYFKFTQISLVAGSILDHTSFLVDPTFRFNSFGDIQSKMLAHTFFIRLLTISGLPSPPTSNSRAKIVCQHSDFIAILLPKERTRDGLLGHSWLLES